MSDPTKATNQNDSELPAGAEADGDVAASDAAGTMSDAQQREFADLKDRYLRQAAEYDNFRRRATKERQEAGWRGQGDLVRGLLDAIDDVTRFAHVDPVTVDAKTVIDGVQLVERKLFKSLTTNGFEIVDPTDQPFDPARHEAVTTVPTDVAEQDHTVAATYQVGYVINGLVLRPARVVVRQYTPGTDETEGAESGSSGASGNAGPFVS